MSEQNYENLLQNICNREKIQVLVTKSGELSWQISLVSPISIEKENSLISQPILENADKYNLSLNFSNEVNLQPISKNNNDIYLENDVFSQEKSSNFLENKQQNPSPQSLNISQNKQHEVNAKLIDKIGGNISSELCKLNDSDLLTNIINTTHKDTREKQPTRNLLERSSKLPRKKKLIQVFISYCHDNKEHQCFTQQLVNTLIQKGIHCIFDLYEEPYLNSSWTNWMVQKIEKADFIIVVCNKEYKKAAKQSKNRGVAKELYIIRERFFNRLNKNPKIIPIIFSEKERENIPDFLQGINRYLLDTKNNDIYRENYDKLYRHITGQHTHKPPPQGEIEIM